jgi:ketosteroid isomerase-like protein
MPEGEWAGRVRESFEALNRGDVDAALAWCHPEVELKRVDGSPDERDLVRGRDAVAEFLAPDVFERQTLEPLDVFEGERVAVAHTIFRATGSASGLETEVETWIVYSIGEDGLVRRIENWTRREDAARSSGLDLQASGI